MADALVLIVFLLALSGPVAAFVRWSNFRKANAQLRRFAPIIDIDSEVSRIRAQSERELAAPRKRRESELNQEAQQLQTALSQSSQQQQQLASEIANLEESSELQQIALYSTRYHLAHSSDYQIHLERLWEHQKALFRPKRTAWCSEQWPVSGSRAQGKRVTDKIADEYFKLKLEELLLTTNIKKTVSLSEKSSARLENRCARSNGPSRNANKRSVTPRRKLLDIRTSSNELGQKPTHYMVNREKPPSCTVSECTIRREGGSAATTRRLVPANHSIATNRPFLSSTTVSMG